MVVRVGRILMSQAMFRDASGRPMAAVYVKPAPGVLAVAIARDLNRWSERIAVRLAEERAIANPATHGLVYTDELPPRPRVLASPPDRPGIGDRLASPVRTVG